MGYESYYKLTWARLETVPPQPNCPHSVVRGMKYCPECGKTVGFALPEKQIQDWISHEKKNDECESFYGVTEEGVSTERCKWYSHREDMQRLSVAFPTVLFTLRIDGEETGDHRLEYFLNGKIQEEKAIISFPDFNKSKLKSLADAKGR